MTGGTISTGGSIRDWQDHDVRVLVGAITGEAADLLLQRQEALGIGATTKQ